MVRIVKLNYILQNSFFNLIRTKGIVPTFILSVLISIIAFFCFTLFLFFSHVHQQMVLDLERETDSISIQMGMGPIMGMLIFKITSFLLFISLLFLTIGYIKKSFQQFLVTQRNEYRIMSFLGETSTGLQLFYTIQLMIFSFLAICLGSFIGNELFHYSVINTIKIAIDSESVNTFKNNLVFVFFIVLFVLVYLFITSFLMSKKKILATIS